MIGSDRVQDIILKQWIWMDIITYFTKDVGHTTHLIENPAVILSSVYDNHIIKFWSVTCMNILAFENTIYQEKNSIAMAGSLLKYWVHYLPREWSLWYRGFLSLSGKEIWDANESMRCTNGEANCGHTCSKAVSPWNQAKYHEYTLEEMVKIGRYSTKNGPAKAARQFCMVRFHEACIMVVTYFFNWGTYNKIAVFKILLIWYNHGILA